MLKQSTLLSEAHFAIAHIRRLKRLVRHRPSARPLQRRVRALEEAALRMELEVKAHSVRRWRAQPHEFFSPMSKVESSKIEYLDTHH